MISKSHVCVAAALAGALSVSSVSWAQSVGPSPARITTAIRDDQLVTLGGNTRPEAIKKNDLGAVPDSLVLAHMHHHVQIPRRASPNSRLAIPGRPETGTVIDPGGDLKLDSRPFLQSAIASAIPARAVDYLAGSTTPRAGLRNLEKSTRGNHLAATLTSGTRGRARAGFGSRSAATGARFVLQDFDLFFSPKRRFLQSDLQVIP